ncbi:hypothetical protein J2X63_002096 [Agromyces sp. 3263]|uniref:DUF1761 family protein n=1 Tax=Agromyces sp. 3263 TaxID=2817750 RepID=UPI002858E004|nr:DUF1761 family protein [Agromyces sp. 3263]MDR6906410.1 hypothetical protein [Agromyces sp. 3263]
MAAGVIWYARGVFGTRWAKLANDDMDRPGASAVMPHTVTVLVSFVTAGVLAGASTIAWHFYGGGYLVATLLAAVILWAGFTAAFTTRRSFAPTLELSRRPPANRRGWCWCSLTDRGPQGGSLHWLARHDGDATAH